MVGKQIKGIGAVILVILFNLSSLLSQNVMIVVKNVNHFSPKLADDHFSNTLAYFNSGNTDSAIEEYEKALQFHPGHIGALLNLALMKKDEGDNAAAFKYLHEAEILDPDFPLTNYNLGVLYHEVGWYDEAKSSYLRAIKFNDQMVAAYTNLGRLYETLEEMDKSMRNYRKALKIDPDFALAKLNMGRALLTQSKYNEALTHFMSIVSKYPDNGIAHFYIAVVYYFLQDYTSSWHRIHLARNHGSPTDQKFIKALKAAMPEPELIN